MGRHPVREWVQGGREDSRRRDELPEEPSHCQHDQLSPSVGHPLYPRPPATPRAPESLLAGQPGAAGSARRPGGACRVPVNGARCTQSNVLSPEWRHGDPAAFHRAPLLPPVSPGLGTGPERPQRCPLPTQSGWWGAPSWELHLWLLKPGGNTAPPRREAVYLLR